MAVLALLLESGRSGLLLPLLSEELGGPSCVQQLVHVAAQASQPSGVLLPSSSLLQAMIFWQR